MSRVLWRKDGGEKVFFPYDIDASEAVQGGAFDTFPPKGEKKPDDLSSAQISDAALLGEKQRLGSVLSGDEQKRLAAAQASLEAASPAETLPPVVVEPTRSAPVEIDPARATREDLLAWLKSYDEPASAGTSTVTLREQVKAKLGERT